jgi:hypothetical protein
MIRRAFLVAAAATALILAPSVAMAYNAPGYNCTVSDSTPASGAPFTVNMTGADANEVVTATIESTPASISSSSIQIAGIKAFTKTASASGALVFKVTLNQPGSYAITMTNVNSAVLTTQTVTVAAVGAAVGAVAPAATGTLSFTGFDGMPIAIGGGVLVILGAGAVLVARRRKSGQVPA